MRLRAPYTKIVPRYIGNGCLLVDPRGWKISERSIRHTCLTYFKTELYITLGKRALVVTSEILGKTYLQVGSTRSRVGVVG